MRERMRGGGFAAVDLRVRNNERHEPTALECDRAFISADFRNGINVKSEIFCIRTSWPLCSTIQAVSAEDYRVMQKSWCQVARKVQPIYSQPSQPCQAGA